MGVSTGDWRAFAMSNSPRTVVSLITAPTDKARSIADVIVEGELAACVNIVPLVQSVYRWEGKIESDDESLLVVKTTEAAIPDLRARLDEVHPYDNFELITLNIEGGNQPYIDWIRDSVAS
jgi:periplasmic divalent cation tolerance protein